MKLLLTGGSAGGKSTYGEWLAARLPRPRWYVAAMRPYGPESLAKIARHREEHRRLGFTTVERYTDLAGLVLPERGTVLVECLCNLLDNEMFNGTGAVRDAVPDVLRGLDALAEQSRHLILVTNEVGGGGDGGTPAVRAYLDALGRLNRAAAARCGCVAEVVCGIPLACKGELPLVPALERDRDLTLVVGGAASGKRTYVQSLGYGPEDMADGVLDERPVVLHVERMVARDPAGAAALLPALLEKRVVVCAEVGGGIVPAAPEQRAVRKATGALCAQLARRAARVVRLTAGLPAVLSEQNARKEREAAVPPKPPRRPTGPNVHTKNQKVP